MKIGNFSIEVSDDELDVITGLSIAAFVFALFASAWYAAYSMKATTASSIIACVQNTDLTAEECKDLFND